MGYINLNGGQVYRKKKFTKTRSVCCCVDLARVGVLVIQFSHTILPVGVQRKQ